MTSRDSAAYALTYDIDRPSTLDRVTTAFRLLWVIPIAIIYWLVSASGYYSTEVFTANGEFVETVAWSTGGIVAGLAAATGLMIIFRQKYPRWWFDFAVEFTRFVARIAAYVMLLTDRYPSTDEEQSIHIDVEYPDVEHDLNRWMPLVKWLLVIPHIFVLAFLILGAFLAAIVAWFAILFTGRYPEGLFDFVAGVTRWTLRVDAYAILLVTDEYPPFSLR